MIIDDNMLIILLILSNAFVNSKTFTVSHLVTAAK